MSGETFPDRRRRATMRSEDDLLLESIAGNREVQDELAIPRTGETLDHLLADEPGTNTMIIPISDISWLDSAADGDLIDEPEPQNSDL